MTARSTVGYYVHHHGAGHRFRFEKIAACTDSLLQPISELDFGRGVQLGTDVPDVARDPTANGSLHWAPVGSHEAAVRAQQIADWVVDHRPAGAVIDVSVEAALLFRLLGVPTIVVRQHGDRTDSAHESAYRSAHQLLAPYPAELDHQDTPRWVVAKTVYCGFIMGTSQQARSETAHPGADDVVVLWGTGGGQLAAEDIAAIARAARPGRVWLAGKIAASVDVNESNVVTLGHVDDVQALLRQRPTVVASAGNNVVADVARSGSALVVVPQQRPFDEQFRHAQSLESANAAVMITSCDGCCDWGSAFEAARQRRTQLARLAGSDGALMAGRLIDAAFG